MGYVEVELIKAYERFIPREMLRMLEKEDITKVRLGNQVEKEMTVMFSDIRGFTPMSEEISLPDDSNRLYTLFRIQLLVVDRLVTHTAKQDRHLGRFIKRKQRGLSTL